MIVKKGHWNEVPTGLYSISEIASSLVKKNNATDSLSHALATTENAVLFVTKGKKPSIVAKYWSLFASSRRSFAAKCNVSLLRTILLNVSASKVGPIR